MEVAGPTRIGVTEVLRDGHPDRRLYDAGLNGVELGHQVVEVFNHRLVLLAEADVDDDLVRLGLHADAENLGPIPDETRCAGAYFTGPRDGWTVIGSYFGEPSSLAGTRDGGRTWTVRQLPVAALRDGVAFRTATDGHLVPESRADDLRVYATGDGDDSWREQPLRLPKGVRRRVRPLLSPPRYADDGSAVMVLRADFGSESAPIPPAAGLYAYRLAPGAQTWSAPVKLPTVRSWEDRDLASYGRDGRLWAASGHDLWRNDDPARPWTHTVVPLPDDVGIAAMGSYGGSTVWLATRPRLAAPPRPRGGTGSRLYRSGDGGASWQKVTVRCG